MQRLDDNILKPESAKSAISSITTTLWDLTKEIKEEIGIPDDHLVAEIVSNILAKAGASFLDTSDSFVASC